MRYEPHTYEGAKARASQIILRLNLNEVLLEQSLDMWESYVRATDPINGKAQPNKVWDGVSNRYGYENDIPGAIGEIISHTKMAQLYGKDAIRITQDEQTQRFDKIDFFAGANSVQVKTTCIMSSRVRLNRAWTEGIANHLCIVDIDSHRCMFFDRLALIENWKSTKGDFWEHEVEAATIHNFNTNNLY